MISEDNLRSLIAAGEARLVEFKVAWPDLSKKAGKATLAKDVLALANSTGRNEAAFLIFGVGDEREGSAIPGVASPPAPEAVAQILAEYTQPPPDATLRQVALDGKSVSVLQIRGSRPHHAAREHTGILEPTLLYIRRDRTNGIATSRELEDMLHERDAARGLIFDDKPLRAGFVGVGLDGRSLIVRVTNVVDRAVAGIEVLVDLEHISMPEIKARQRVLSNLTLGPGQSREAEMSAAQQHFYRRYFEPANPGVLQAASLDKHGFKIGDRWLTARLRVYYRNDEGFLQEIVREMALDG